MIRLLVLAAFVTALFATSANALDLEVDVKPPPGEAGTPYTFEFFGEEGCVPYRYSYLNGTVPPGLQITVDGKLTGTPTEAGSFSFWVGLDDNSGPHNPFCQIPSMQSQGEFTMVVLPDLAVTTTSLPLAVPGTTYSAQLQFSNPEFGWPVTWDITQGALPGGLTLSESGLISGTPGGPDTKTFTVRAREQFRRFGERQLTLTVAAALRATSAARVGEVGLRYRGSIPASGGLQPLAWSVGSGALPHGLSLNVANGAIHGVPGAAGLFPVTFAVSDAAGQRATVPAVIRIAARLKITTARLPIASVGTTYRAQLRSRGGLAPKQWRIRGTLVRGLRLDPKTGVLAGIPRNAGVFRITVRATDRLGGKATKSLRLRVSG